MGRTETKVKSGAEIKKRGMLEMILGKAAKIVPKKSLGTFKMFSGYTPAFTSWHGDLYDSDIVRSAVDATARHISKLVVSFEGPALPKLKTAVKKGPNALQTWSQFLYQLATIYKIENNVIILPVLNINENPKNPEVRGYVACAPSRTELLEDEDGGRWYRYTFGDGSTVYMEQWRCGIMRRFQYKNEVFGEDNSVLNSTLQLIHMTKQGIQEGIRNSATFRFMAQMDNLTDDQDLTEEMNRFNRAAFRGESGGILLFPAEYANIKQIEPKPYTPDAEQMKLTQGQIYDYMAVNSDVVQNTAIGDKWAAFYDGELEPFAIQLKEVLDGMTYTVAQLCNGNGVRIVANRLQYASTKEKLEVSAQMADRGIMNRNEIRLIWGLDPIEGPEGEMFLVRGEYKNALGEAEDQEDTGGEDNAEE